MHLTVYRQAEKVRPNGAIVYKGEDARPYVNNQLFMVADGLGGAASIRHQQIRPELFESDKLVSVLFNGVYEEYDEEFVKYVTDSFFELFAVKDCYTENVNNIKKSGYFASRIVTAILLHEVIHNDKCSAKAVFEAYNKASGEKAKAEVLSKFGKLIKDTLQTNLRKVAKNANLIYESSYTGLALLGSTLCATLYLEHEDCVEAIYLTAGDSRPYVWSPDDGLCQVLLDQERKDGGMTNYIRANDDSDFNIECHYFKFSKPCVLFNVTDGCFDSAKFISPLAFEKLILDSAEATASTEAISEELTSFFAEYGRHDDSSTIAMKFFGFDSFDSFKLATKKRLSVINDEYLSTMPELLEVDFAHQYEESTKELPKKLLGLKKRFETQDSVRNFCIKHVKNGKYQPFEQARREIDGEIATKKGDIERARDTIDFIIKRNFVKLKPYFKYKERCIERLRIKVINHIEELCEDKINAYSSLVKKYEGSFVSSVRGLGDVLSQVIDTGVPKGTTAFGFISRKNVTACVFKIIALVFFFLRLRAGKNHTLKRIKSLQDAYAKRNIKLAKKHANLVTVFREKIEAGIINISELELPEEDENILVGAVTFIVEAQQEIKRLDTVEKEQVAFKLAAAYWEKNYMMVIRAVINNPEIEESLRAEAKAILDESEKQEGIIKLKYEQQNKLFSKYEKTYGKFIGGTIQ